MFRSNFQIWSRGRLGLTFGNDRHAWQWQPITYGTGAAHDPSPPIIIEDAPTVPPLGGSESWPILTGKKFWSNRL